MLTNKTAIITGSNRGIGKAILEIFLKNNATVWACSRNYNENDYKDLINTYENKINFISFDLGNIEEVKKSANSIIKENDKIDILVNNAGIIHSSLFQMTNIDDMKNLFEINYFSQLAFTQIIIKKIIKAKNPSIINIASNAALDSFAGRSSYSSSKSAMISFSKILSKELGRKNVRVNCIAPGLTNTELMKNSHTEKIINETINRTSLQRIADPEDIANVALFLASDLSKHITGETIRVDGGL